MRRLNCASAVAYPQRLWKAVETVNGEIFEALNDMAVEEQVQIDRP